MLKINDETNDKCPNCRQTLFLKQSDLWTWYGFRKTYKCVNCNTSLTHSTFSWYSAVIALIFGVSGIYFFDITEYSKLLLVIGGILLITAYFTSSIKTK